MKKDGDEQIFTDPEPLPKHPKSQFYRGPNEMPPPQKGWLLLAVQFRSGKSGLFRIEYFHPYRPPEPDDLRRMLFDGEDFGGTSITFSGEKFDPKSGEWIEKCYIAIPDVAYDMASWQYYAADDPKWQGLTPAALAEEQI